MAEDREKIRTGPKERPVNEPMAESKVPGKRLPERPTADQLAEVDTLPLDGE